MSDLRNRGDNDSVDAVTVEMVVVEAIVAVELSEFSSKHASS